MEKFDYIIFTDGSGSKYENSCAGSAIIINCDNNSKNIILAGKSNGTNMLAELLPVIDGLAHIERLEPKRKVKILIVSDSEVTVKSGNKEYSRTNNAYMWASFEYFEKKWNIKFKHIYRNSDMLNTKCDELAGKIRKAFEDIKNEY